LAGGAQEFVVDALDFGFGGLALGDVFENADCAVERACGIA
jgi:hypothetical protein